MAALTLVSGGSRADPQTPPALPRTAAPFLATALAGSGAATAAIDSYGSVVDLRERPGGRALIDNPADRQVAGSVPEDTGIVPGIRIGAGPPLALWQADSVAQRYLPKTNVVVTVARFGGARVIVEVAMASRTLALRMRARAGGKQVTAQIAVDDLGGAARCRQRQERDGLDLSCRTDGGRLRGGVGQIIAMAAEGDRDWLARARPLGAGAPPWARRLYERSLLTLRALTDAGGGASIAGARDGWAYVWPRDASATAIALAAAGYRAEAERVVRFLLGLGLEQAARFNGDGSPVPGRPAQGDAIGWVAAASRAAGIIGSAEHAARILAGGGPAPWRDRADYREGEPGDYLGNAIASGEPAIDHLFGGQSQSRLVREPSDPDSGLDSAAAWAVRPFSRPRLYPAVRATLNRLASQATAFGITPGEDWPGGEDPWSAPTAWTAWSLAALGEHRQALRLMQALRRAATPAGDLPERVDARTGIPTSTTPLAWSHAFAILALRELWPG